MRTIPTHQKTPDAGVSRCVNDKFVRQCWLGMTSLAPSKTTTNSRLANLNPRASPIPLAPDYPFSAYFPFRDPFKIKLKIHKIRSHSMRLSFFRMKCAPLSSFIGITDHRYAMDTMS